MAECFAAEFLQRQMNEPVGGLASVWAAAYSVRELKS